MQLQKVQLEVFFKVLKGTEGLLDLKESRERDRFMRSLVEETTTYEGERKVIYEKFCNRSEDGTPDTSDGKYKFPAEVLPELSSEVEVLNKELVSLVYTPGLTDMVLRSAYKPLVGEAESIDLIVTALTSVVPTA